MILVSLSIVIAPISLPFFTHTQKKLSRHQELEEEHGTKAGVKKKKVQNKSLAGKGVKRKMGV